MITTWRLAACLCLVAPLVSAQKLLWEKFGHTQLWLTGPSFFVSDVNGDGYADLMHGAFAFVPPSTAWEGQLLTVSGRDGRTLRAFRDPNRTIRGLARAGDVDGDGLVDYAITRGGSFPPTTAEVRSGADDSLIWSVSSPSTWTSTEWGSGLLGDLDLDGDGRPDLLVSARRETPPALYAYDNAGLPLYKLEHVTAGSLGAVGDLDGDGCDEFVVGGGNSTYTQGVALVYSGKTGSLLLVGHGEPGAGVGSGHAFGCGDVDGDGVLDFVASSDGRLKIGIVRVFSGVDASPIHTWQRGYDSFFGQALAAGDLDRDGVADLLVGTTLCGTMRALDWYSLRDGSLVTVICSPNPGSWPSSFGGDVAIGPPQPGSPFGVFVSAQPRWGSGGPYFPSRGKLDMFRGAPAGVEGLGPGCSGTLTAAPQIGLTGLPASVRLHLSDAPTGSPALLLLGLSSTTWAGLTLPLGLGPFGFPGCTLYTSVELALGVTTGTAGLASGYAFVDLPAPLSSGLGITLHGQWLALAPGPPAASGFTGALSWEH